MKNYFRGSSAKKKMAYSVSMERHRVSQKWFIEKKTKILCLAEIITLCLLLNEMEVQICNHVSQFLNSTTVSVSNGTNCRCSYVKKHIVVQYMQGCNKDMMKKVIEENEL